VLFRFALAACSCATRLLLRSWRTKAGMLAVEAISTQICIWSVAEERRR